VYKGYVPKRYMRISKGSTTTITRKNYLDSFPKEICDCCKKKKYIQCTTMRGYKVVQRWCQECNILYCHLGWLDL